MHGTRNDLPLETRGAMITLLNQRLADTIDLFNQLKQAHWNVKGPQFIALHELFDKLAEGSEAWSDELAERAVSLGGQADGTSQIVAERSALPVFDRTLSDGRQHLVAVAGAMATYARHVRAAINAADEHGDQVTSDLFTGIAGEADKNLWFVEAHLQGS